MGAVLKLAKECGYDSVIGRGKWKGYTVYEMVFDTEEPQYIGLPQYILENHGKMRLAEIAEIFSVLDWLEENNGNR